MGRGWGNNGKTQRLYVVFPVDTHSNPRIVLLMQQQSLKHDAWIGWYSCLEKVVLKDIFGQLDHDDNEKNDW